MVNEDKNGEYDDLGSVHMRFANRNIDARDYIDEVKRNEFLQKIEKLKEIRVNRKKPKQKDGE